jgi:hypothetical protein
MKHSKAYAAKQPVIFKKTGLMRYFFSGKNGMIPGIMKWQ